MAIKNGAVPDTIEVQIEIDPQTSKVTAIALGSTEVQTTDLLKACTEIEAAEIAAKSMGVAVESTNLLVKSDVFYVFSATKNNKEAIRLIDKKGFIKVQRGDGTAISCKLDLVTEELAKIWDVYAVFKNDMRLVPDLYMCIGGKVLDFEGMMDFDQMLMIVGTELSLTSEDEVIIVVARNNL